MTVTDPEPCSRLCPFVACATCPWPGTRPDPDLLDQLEDT